MKDFKATWQSDSARCSYPVFKSFLQNTLCIKDDDSTLQLSLTFSGGKFGFLWRSVQIKLYMSIFYTFAHRKEVRKDPSRANAIAASLLSCTETADCIEFNAKKIIVALSSWTPKLFRNCSSVNVFVLRLPAAEHKCEKIRGKFLIKGKGEEEKGRRNREKCINSLTVKFCSDRRIVWYAFQWVCKAFSFLLLFIRE